MWVKKELECIGIWIVKEVVYILIPTKFIKGEFIDIEIPIESIRFKQALVMNIIAKKQDKVFAIRTPSGTQQLGIEKAKEYIDRHWKKS